MQAGHDSGIASPARVSDEQGSRVMAGPGRYEPPVDGGQVRTPAQDYRSDYRACGGRFGVVVIVRQSGR